MLIANRTNDATKVEIAYFRQHGSEPVERDTVTVSLDKGPELMWRARAHVAIQCAAWTEKDRRWHYWLAD